MKLKASNSTRFDEDSGKKLWFYFLIWPFLTFFYAVKNFSTKKYRKFILLFGVLYGLSFIPIPESDATRYAERFEAMEEYTFDSYWYDITHIYEIESTYPDVYAYTLFFLTSKITNSVHVFFMLSALIYFFVFLKLIYSLYDLFPRMRRHYFIWFFLGCVFIYNFSAGVNGLRFPLAFMVFSYGALNVIIKNNKNFLFIALLSPLIHFTLLYACVFLLLHTFVPIIRNNIFLLSLLILAVVANTFFGDFIQNNIGILGESYQDYLEGYMGEGYIERRSEHVTQWNWYVQLRAFGNYYFAMVVLAVVWISKRSLRFNHAATKLFAFAVLMVVASLITGGMLDPISNRYANLVSFFTLSFLLYLSVLNRRSRMLKTISRVYIPIFIFTALVILRGDLYTVSPFMFVGNPILSLFIDPPFSIQELFLGK